MKRCKNHNEHTDLGFRICKICNSKLQKQCHHCFNWFEITNFSKNIKTHSTIIQQRKQCVICKKDILTSNYSRHMKLHNASKSLSKELSKTLLQQQAGSQMEEASNSQTENSCDPPQSQKIQ